MCKTFEFRKRGFVSATPFLKNAHLMQPCYDFEQLQGRRVCINVIDNVKEHIPTGHEHEKTSTAIL